jgi:sigma-B regulation protein RsbU (phosphoserine phosphatase)
MILVNKVGGGAFTENDRLTLERLLNFVAVAIDNANLISEKLSRQKIEQEMAIARQVQKTILPPNIDNIGGVDIGAVYAPAREVGGDFYDVVPVDGDRFLVVIGDVSNKGVPAALVMSAAAGIIKSTVRQESDISVSELASAVNELLADGIIRDHGMFVTMFFAKFDLAARVMTYCNAGHIPGLYWDAHRKTVLELTPGGPIVGQFTGIPFQQGDHRIHSADRLFLFTDGLTEAADVRGNMYGRDRAKEAFSGYIDLSPNEFCLKLKQLVDAFASGAAEDTHDDFTVLQVKVR